MGTINKKEDVIERLCQLVSHVGKEKFKHELAHDCFCKTMNTPDNYFIVDEEVLEFIEMAVNKELAK